MKKHKKIILIIIIILVCVSCFILLNKESIVTSVRKTFFKATIVATGTTGTCNWTLDSDGLLLIEPANGVSGTMDNYVSSGSFYDYSDEIISIKFNGTVYLENSAYGLFYDLHEVEEIDMTNLNAQSGSITNMQKMFCGCNSLTEIDLSNFNTQNVNYMNSMFKDCNSLRELDTSSLNTTSCTDMMSMFEGCELLEEIDVSNFETQYVRYMNNMFYGCKSLLELDVSNFNTRYVGWMDGMFSGCELLTELDVSDFNTQEVVFMMGMFQDCKSLTELDLSSFNTQNLLCMWDMFNGCESLTELNLGSFNTQSVSDMNRLMQGCNSLKTLTLGPNFSFIHKTNELDSYSTPWKKLGTTSPRYTSSELMNTYNGSTMAGTYVRVNVVTISLKKDNLTWSSNNMRAALYQNGTEIYSYSQGEISSNDGTITWDDVAPGTYDIYASKDEAHSTTMVDTGQDIVVAE